MKRSPLHRHLLLQQPHLLFSIQINCDCSHRKLSDLLLNSSSELELPSRLSELEDCTEAEKIRKVEATEEMKGAVRRLAEGREEETVRAASEVRRLAKDDPFARETLAMLGVIPPLVEMMECGDDEWKSSRFTHF